MFLFLYAIHSVFGRIKEKRIKDYKIQREWYFQCNPFRDAIYRVFSSKQDGHLSFEDTLDLCSAFSSNCPQDVRAAWAFEIFGMLASTIESTSAGFCVCKILTLVLQLVNICHPPILIKMLANNATAGWQKYNYIIPLLVKKKYLDSSFLEAYTFHQMRETLWTKRDVQLKSSLKNVLCLFLCKYLI